MKFDIPIPSLETFVFCYIGKAYHFKAFLKRRFPKHVFDIDAHDDGATYYFGHTVIIYYPKKPSRRCICHESVHAALDILYSRGQETFKYTNSEPLAYLTDYIFQFICDKVFEKGND